MVSLDFSLHHYLEFGYSVDVFGTKVDVKFGESLALAVGVKQLFVGAIQPLVGFCEQVVAVVQLVSSFRQQFVLPDEEV